MSIGSLENSTTALVLAGSCGMHDNKKLVLGTLLYGLLTGINTFVV
jgi:hypothetical protein